ncbi:hypothetical protein AALP_AA6G217200 [Arabis alpina]|uniref:Uncharacterized protein n=1 Tax=Arabis alpina TaxID=50452 RepID=A0A087GQU5_ARAAL|nr:hypothetical protein AALP_AA6G217200 [Arabis alpina]
MKDKKAFVKYVFLKKKERYRGGKKIPSNSSNDYTQDFLRRTCILQRMRLMLMGIGSESLKLQLHKTNLVNKICTIKVNLVVQLRQQLGEKSSGP